MNELDIIKNYIPLHKTMLEEGNEIGYYLVVEVHGIKMLVKIKKEDLDKLGDKIEWL